MSGHVPPNPSGLCFCGCGETTGRSPRGCSKYRRGDHFCWIRGHSLHPAEFWTVDEETGCWNWHSANGLGYGVITIKRRGWLAHRWVYEQRVGPIPDGLQLDHLCRNRRCVNPEHLEPVTQAENTRRGLATKLTAEQVAEIRAAGGPLRPLAERFGVDPSTICHIRKGRKSWVAA